MEKKEEKWENILFQRKKLFSSQNIFSGKKKKISLKESIFPLQATFLPFSPFSFCKVAHDAYCI